MSGIPDPGAPSGTFAALRNHPVDIDLTDARARRDRDALVDRVDVLDKVAVLRTLPGGTFVTSEMVATFYEVPLKTIQSAVLRNREELDSDGVTTLSKAEMELTFNMKAGRAGSFLLYPRRAVLRIGMLLRDSDVARQVRGYLLDVEVAPRLTQPMTGPELMAAALLEANRVLGERDKRIAELSPSAEAWDALVAENHTYRTDDAAKILSGDPLIGPLGQRRLQQFLAGQTSINGRELSKPWIYRGRGGKRWSAYQAQVDLGRVEMKPGGLYPGRDESGLVKRGEPVVVITAKGLADLRQLLTSSGQLALV